MTPLLSIRRIVKSLIRTKMYLVHNLTEVYRPSIPKNRLTEILKDKVETAMKSELARKMRVLKEYYTLEMTPPSMNEMERIKADLALVKDFIASGCFKYLTVRQAWLLFLVGLEVYLWFYLGETIGKFHLVGYKV